MNATTPPPSEGKSPRVREVPAVSRALAILRLLASRPESMTLKAISDELGLVASTCLHILRVLVEEGMVKVEAATKRYSLDVGVLSLAQSVVEQNPFPVRVQNVLEEISAEWDVTTIGMKVSGLEDLVVLALARSKGPFRLYVEVGSRVPALTSATGRLVAHYMELSDEALSSKFEELNWENPPAFDAWIREIRAVERKGFAIDRGNYINGISVLAIPILNRQHKMTYAIAALGVTNRFSAADLQDLGKYMQSRASTLAG